MTAAYACRWILWEELIDYLGKKEANLLTICDDSNATNETRDRLFEYIGCQGRGAKFQVGAARQEFPAGRFELFAYQISVYQRFEFDECFISLGKAKSMQGRARKRPGH